MNKGSCLSAWCILLVTVIPSLTRGDQKEINNTSYLDVVRTSLTTRIEHLIDYVDTLKPHVGWYELPLPVAQIYVMEWQYGGFTDDAAYQTVSLNDREETV